MTIAVPLTNLTRKSNSSKILWNQQCTFAFEKLKAALCSAPVLRSPNFELPFVLQTNAADNGVGGVLSQYDEKNEEHQRKNEEHQRKNEEHPIAYLAESCCPENRSIQQ